MITYEKLTMREKDRIPNGLFRVFINGERKGVIEYRMQKFCSMFVRRYCYVPNQGRTSPMCSSIDEVKRDWIENEYSGSCKF